MHNPPHPGQLIEHDVMAPLGLSLSGAASRFGVEAQYLADVLSKRARINATLAAGLERAGFSTARAWIEMQAVFDRYISVPG
ncbi:HigA family addiction module antitoxin [Achromobacter sp. PAB15]|uniref:HigA family addiction module antitoxin n=1 Tax=Achromobacter sp. PAB15 TaxID=3233048 RepID=UPI003F9257CD